MVAPPAPRIPWWPLPVLIVLAFLVFWPVLGLTAFSDDHSAVWNSGVRGIPWRTGFLRPVSDLTFKLVDLLAGPSAFGHRCFTVALHGLNAFLVFAIYQRVTRTVGATQVGPWIAALLFLVYPFHQESIVWLVGRESILGTLSVLIGLMAVTSGRSNSVRVIMASLSMLIGLLCYGSALLLPVLAAATIAANVAPGGKCIRPMALGLGAVLLVYATILIANGSTVQGSYVGGLLDKGLWELVMGIPKVGARLFLPPVSDPMLMSVLAAILAVAIAGPSIIWWRKATPGNKAVALLLVALLMIACIQPIVGGVSTRTSESDRFLYLPSVFFCMLIAWAIARIQHRVLRLAVVMGVLLTSTLFLQLNHANWRSASRTTSSILSGLPSAPAHGVLFVSGLPDSENGAFIFRNGFREAVFLSGRPGERYIEVKDLAFAMDRPVLYRDSMHIPEAGDGWAVWTNGRFRVH